MLTGLYFKDDSCIYQIISEPIYHHEYKELIVVVKDTTNNFISPFLISEIKNVESNCERF